MFRESPFVPRFMLFAARAAGNVFSYSGALVYCATTAPLARPHRRENLKLGRGSFSLGG